jgi:hypothetical protein
MLIHSNKTKKIQIPQILRLGGKSNRTCLEKNYNNSSDKHQVEYLIFGPHWHKDHSIKHLNPLKDHYTINPKKIMINVRTIGLEIGRLKMIN